MDQVKTYKCPSCGAPVTFEDSREFVYCSHCGTQIFKNDILKTEHTYRVIDEAKINESKSDLLMTKARIVVAVFGMIICIACIVFLFSRL